MDLYVNFFLLSSTVTAFRMHSGRCTKTVTTWEVGMPQNSPLDITDWTNFHRLTLFYRQPFFQSQVKQTKLLSHCDQTTQASLIQNSCGCSVFSPQTINPSEDNILKKKNLLAMFVVHQHRRDGWDKSTVSCFGLHHFVSLVRTDMK